MGMFSGDVWAYGRLFSVLGEDGLELRQFRGFLEHRGLSGAAHSKSRAGLVSNERFKLISEPGEDFPEGTGTKICCEGQIFELISTFEIYAGDGLSHRESVLRRSETGG